MKQLNGKLWADAVHIELNADEITIITRCISFCLIGECYKPPTGANRLSYDLESLKSKMERKQKRLHPPTTPTDDAQLLDEEGRWATKHAKERRAYLDLDIATAALKAKRKP